MEDTTASTVYAVDDDELAREWVTLALQPLDQVEVRVFASGPEFLAAYQPAAPGCVLLDLHLPELGGLQIQRQLRDRAAEPPIIFMTKSSDISIAVTAMQAGAFHFLQKPVERVELVATVERALVFDKQRRETEFRQEMVRLRIASLSPREREVLTLLFEGKSNKEMASALQIGQRTVEIHRARLMHKLQVTSIAQLVRLCRDIL